MASHHKPYLQVGVILPKLLEFLTAQGLPKMEVGDFYAETRAPLTPGYNPSATIMVSDHRDGPYIAVKLARTPLPSTDSMKLLATHLSGYINFDVDFGPSKKASSSRDADDATIMKAFVRPEVKGSDKSYARCSLSFYREDRNIGKGEFGRTIEIDIETGDLKLCDW